MEFNMRQFLREIESEKRDVNIVYKGLSQESYRKGVLEGIRLGVVIARNATTADTAEASSSSIQQLRAEIAAIVERLQRAYAMRESPDVLDCISGLRQLSAV